MKETDIDNLVDDLERDLKEAYEADRFITLRDLNIKITKFSNVTLGSDAIEYGLISTKDISVEGAISFSTIDIPLKHKGSAKGVEKYKVQKGDIIFPHSGRRFNSAGVITEDPDLALVGNHGLMKISFNKENLELSFLIKDYLQLSAVGQFVSRTKISVEILEKLPIPIVDGKILNYKEASIKIKQCEAKVQEIELALVSAQEKLQFNAFKGKYDVNEKLTSNLSSVHDHLEKALKSIKGI